MRRWLGTLFVTGSLAAMGCGGDDDGGGTPEEDTGVYDSTTPTDGGKDSVVADGSDTLTPPDTLVPPDTATGDADAGPTAARTTITNGSAIAITKDTKVAIAVNRTAGNVAIFDVTFGTTPAATRKALLDVGAEPWDVVIGNDDDTAYVIVRKDQKVVKIKGLKGAPTVDATSAASGSEPTGIAISPTGAKLYVSNWAEGTLSVVNTADMTVGTKIDLNAAIAASGLLGTVTGRPGLAHPRSLVISNNGDTSDADESIYVTEFFSQAKTTGVPTDDSQYDLNRQGLIYKVKISDSTITTTTLGPTANTGFKDSNGADTGCFPNQLYAVALNKGDKERLYVTANCASPRGVNGAITTTTPPNLAGVKTEVHASIFVVDTASFTEVPAQAVVLTQKFQSLYDTASVTDDATRRIPLIVNDIAFIDSANVAYVTGYGSDAVFRVAYNADGTFKEVGSPGKNNFITLNPGGTVGAGALPVGLALPVGAGSTNPFSLVINENTRNVSLINLGTQVTVLAADSAAAPPAVDTTKPAGSVYDVQVNKGKKFFVTGLARWSLKGQAWNSCESCHPDGLTDNVTWFFGRGPRQTVSLDGTYDPKDPTKRRILNWTGIFDEVHDFELNTRGNSGGVGAVVWQVGSPVSAGDRIIFDGAAVTAPQLATTNLNQNLNGSIISLMPKTPATPCASTDAKCDNSFLGDWNDVDQFVKFIRAPKKPTNLDAARVAAGKTLFENNFCAGCHGGSQWTISKVFFTPGEGNNNPTTGKLVTTNYTLTAATLKGLNPPGSAGTATPFRLSPVTGASDQINCILRDVGTFPATTGTTAPFPGIALTGVTVNEARTDMTTKAQGATGFNIPSLLGMVTGAPYFHAGNARTIEELFDKTFKKHYQAFSTNMLLDTDTAAKRTADIDAIVAFLSSIDEGATEVPVTATATLGFNPDICASFVP
jgi:DNA-binding beta-propeller fold protein YncE